MTTSHWNMDDLRVRANHNRVRREAELAGGTVDDRIVERHQRMLTVGVQEMYAEQDAYAADLLAAGDAGAYGTGGPS